MIKKKKESASFGVIGLGRFGTALAITLAQAGKEVIAVDRDENSRLSFRSLAGEPNGHARGRLGNHRMTKWERRLTWVWVAFFVWMIWAIGPGRG